MEFILIHKALVPLPPEAGKAMLEFGRKVLTKPGEVVPGGKLIASYAARGQWTSVCIWLAASGPAFVYGTFPTWRP